MEDKNLNLNTDPKEMDQQTTPEEVANTASASEEHVTESPEKTEDTSATEAEIVAPETEEKAIENLAEKPDEKLIKTEEAESTEPAPAEEVNEVAEVSETKDATEDAKEAEEVKEAESTEPAPAEEVNEVAEVCETTDATETKDATEEVKEAEAAEVENPETAEKSDAKEDQIEEVAAEDASTPGEEPVIASKEKEEVKALLEEEEEVDKLAEETGNEDEDDDETEVEEEEDTTVYEDLSLEELVDLMENLVKIEDIASIKAKVLKTNIAYQEKFKAFKVAHKAKFEEENEDEDAEYTFDDGGLNSRFHQAFKIYKQKRKEYIEAQEILKQNNLKRKEEILEELRSLIDSEESLKKIYDEFKNLQEKWRQIGMVPKNDAKNLWMNYNFLVDKFFEKVQIDRELRDIGYKKNLEAKIELAEKAEELLLEKSFTKAFKQIQELFRQWKEIGPVPYDKSEEIWTRFKSAVDKVNQLRREYYQNMAEEQKNNLVLKKELIEKAEAISNIDYTTIKDYNHKTKELDNLMAEWKKLGPAPKAQNDQVWKDFRTCFNTFYSNKRQYFSNLNEQLSENMQAKQDICKTAESLKDSTDWKKTTQELIKLQKEWKKIGPVPYKNSDKIWKRFRSACDHFFSAKENHFKSMKDAEKDNLEKKKALIETIKSTQFSEDKEKAMTEMKDLQKQWIEIGQVPFKMKDRINRDYRSAVDEKLNEIGLSAIDVELARIKERSGGAKEDARESKHLIQREMNAIRTKIDKLKSEIITWENNMGFFANSKNADVLKNEFQSKIDDGNKKVKSMKARLNLLDKTMKSLSEEK
jgi:hypothetical protein